MTDLENKDIVEDDVTSVEETDTQIDENQIDEETEETVVEDDSSEILEEDEDIQEYGSMPPKKKKAMEMAHGKKKKMNMDSDSDDEEEDMKKEMDHGKKKMKKEDSDISDDLEEIVEDEDSADNHMITVEDLDVQEDIDAMLNGQELSEEFQEQVTTIFEAAVVAKVNEKIEDIYSTYETDLQEQVAEIRQELSEKVDEYLSYVAGEYVTENKLAIESGLKVEIMEKFMNGIKSVFEENYIDVPQEKLDLYSEALDTIDSKESELNEQFEKNLQLNKRLVELEKNIVLMNVTEGLTDTQVEKVKLMSEGVEFQDTDDMTKKITLIRDNYFPSETKVESGILDESALETSVEDSPVVQEENKVQSIMDVYAHALNKPKD